MQEIWKDIQDYEGYYQVSNLGRVKSLRSNTILKKVSSLIVLCAKYNDVLPSLINNHRKKEWFQ